MKKFKLTIIRKVSILTIVVALIVILLAAWFYYRVTYNRNIKEYKLIASSFAGIVSEILNVEDYSVVHNKVEEIYDTVPNRVANDKAGTDEWNEYLANYNEVKNLTEYYRLKDFLGKYQIASKDYVDCIYLIFVDNETGNIVFVADADLDHPCAPGSIDYVLHADDEIINHPENGFAPFISKTEEYGFIVSAGSPIFDGNNVIGFAMVDISMEVVHRYLIDTTLRVIFYLLLALVVICACIIVFINKVLIRPIKMLTVAAQKYNNDNVDEEHNYFSEVNIKTQDEVHELSDSMKKMETDINRKISDLVKINRDLIVSQNLATEMSELAKKDGLTGVGNKNSYEVVSKEFNKKIQNNEKIEFAIVMVDLNNLKDTNDTYGHNIGDDALIKLSQIICDIFKHSPVFRVGGDEFVVVLRNRDYDNVDTLISTFKGQIRSIINNESLKPEEKISAAIGYSCFDKNTDKSVEDVFKRADDEMYKCKRKMKENLKK